IHVSVFWVSSTTLSKAESKFVVEGILHVVTALLKQAGNCWRPNLSQVNEIKLGTLIGQICVDRWRRDRSYRHCDQVGAIGHDLERVQTAIRQKDVKVGDYRMKCRFVWLLIVADTKYLSSIFS